MLTLAKSIRTEFPNGFDDMGFLNAGPNVTAAVCVRDHWDAMGEDDRVWCRNVVLELVLRPLTDDNTNEMHAKNPMSGIVECATTLALMINRLPEDSSAKDALIAGLSHFNEDVRYGSVDGVSEILTSKNEFLLKFCLWVIFNQTKQWNQIDARNEKLKWNQRPSMVENWKTALVATRQAANAAWPTNYPSLDALTFESWHDRQLAKMLLRLLSKHPEQQYAQHFFAKIAVELIY